MKTILRAFALAAITCLHAAAQDNPAAKPSITTWTFTAQDCSPLSMLMLFPPYPGFTCKASTTILVSGTDAAVTGYRLEIEYTRDVDGTGSQAREIAFVPVVDGNARWITYEQHVKIRSVTAAPQQSAAPALTVTF